LRPIPRVLTFSGPNRRSFLVPQSPPVRSPCFSFAPTPPPHRPPPYFRQVVNPREDVASTQTVQVPFEQVVVPPPLLFLRAASDSMRAGFCLFAPNRFLLRVPCPVGESVHVPCFFPLRRLFFSGPRIFYLDRHQFPGFLVFSQLKAPPLVGAPSKGWTANRSQSYSSPIALRFLSRPRAFTPLGTWLLPCGQYPLGTPPSPSLVASLPFLGTDKILPPRHPRRVPQWSFLSSNFPTKPQPFNLGLQFLPVCFSGKDNSSCFAP